MHKVTEMKSIPMVDLKAQYADIKDEIDSSISSVIESSWFIKGEAVMNFEKKLADYLEVKHVISCANGTDALMIALMTLELESGDEVISPAFNYIACAEMCKVLGLKPVYVDVYADNYNINVEELESKITNRTKAIMPVHLFGQCANLDAIMQIADKHKLHVIEDNAQSIGAFYNGQQYKGFSGTIGDIGTLSFFPSKNLSCYGDGGAVMTNSDDLATKLRMIANHGQSIKYVHDMLGVNSRLDTIQAAILNVKLNHLADYTAHRQKAAELYDSQLKSVDGLLLPFRNTDGTHVFHQYTLRVLNGKRDALKAHLHSQGIASMIYYPIPVHKQKAYVNPTIEEIHMNSEQLSAEVLSLPIHSHIKPEEITYICKHISNFMNMLGSFKGSHD